jgi:hypothetical protein
MEDIPVLEATDINVADYFRAEEVCTRLGIATKTLDNWYLFKRNDPTNEYAKLLPEYIKCKLKGLPVRLWKKTDLYKLFEFSYAIPRGRKGAMGSISTKYYHRNKEKK